MTPNSEIDGILEAIRAEVRKIKAGGVPAGRAPEADRKPKFQPFRRSEGGRVRAGEILRCHGEEFVRKTYLSLLNRQPDADGLIYWLHMMEDGGRSRITVLRMISESPEGRIHNVPIRGLKIRSAGHSLAEGLRSVPVLGQGLVFLRRLRGLPERVARLERSLRARDSSEWSREEMRGRLERLEERLNRLESLVRGRDEKQGRPDSKRKLRRGAGRRT